MSLINQMLKDLEKRSGLNTGSTFEPAKNPNEANAEAADASTMVIEEAEIKKDKKRPSAFLIISLSFLVVYLAMYYWFTVYNVTPIPRDNFPLAQQTRQTPSAKPVIVDSEAVIAQITAEIESQIRETNGDVDSTRIREMVANARKTDAANIQPSEIEVEAIAEYDTLNDMHLKAEKAESAKKSSSNGRAQEKIATNVTTKSARKAGGDSIEKNRNNVAKISQKETLTPATTLAIEQAEKVAAIKLPPPVSKPITPVNGIKKPAKPSLASQPIQPSRKVANNSQHTGKAKFVKHVRPEQASEQQYQQALTYVQQGRVSEAQNILASAIKTYPKNHDARQTLAALLLDNNRIQDASTVLKDGLTVSPEHVAFRMTAARLEIELGNQPEALTTLLSGVSFAHNNATYNAFLATLLQRNRQHKDAVKYYQTALNIDRGMTNAYIGLGISLQALGQLEEAHVAYSHAQNNRSLNPNLKSFIDYRLKEVETRISAR